MKPYILFFVSLLFCFSFVRGADSGVSSERPRMIVLTDIEADPDDAETLVRLLLYSSEIDIRGFIATTSTHMRESIHPDSIRKIIDAYAKVQPNLLNHDPRFPNADYLLSLVKSGQVVYGKKGIGSGFASEGSNWIVEEIKKEDTRPLWISVWGGANTLAQALSDLRDSCTSEELARYISLLRVYTISDQDDTGSWIRKEFPDLFYIVSPGGYGAATWMGMNRVVDGVSNTTVSNRWIADNIQQGHGPLGATYPDVAYGMEGDTPSWLSLIPNGLNAPEHPDWGGWGGRYELYIPNRADTDPDGFNGNVPIPQETRPIWTNTVDTYTPPVWNEYGRSIGVGPKSFTGNTETIWRWRDDFQNDFAARMDWTVKPYEEANHAPVAAVKMGTRLTVKSGTYVLLDASQSYDPDGDSISYYWFEYPEAGDCEQPIQFAGAENLARVFIRLPKVDKSVTSHIILKVIDKGTPSLVSYKRMILTIEP